MVARGIGNLSARNEIIGRDIARLRIYRADPELAAILNISYLQVGEGVALPLQPPFDVTLTASQVKKMAILPSIAAVAPVTTVATVAFSKSSFSCWLLIKNLSLIYGSPNMYCLCRKSAGIVTFIVSSLGW
jgi:hypothetical protein